MKFEEWLKEFKDLRFNFYKEGCSLFDEGKYGEAWCKFDSLVCLCDIAKNWKYEIDSGNIKLEEMTAIELTFPHVCQNCRKVDFFIIYG